MKIFTKTFKSGWQIMNIIQVKSRFTAKKNYIFALKKMITRVMLKGNPNYGSQNPDLRILHWNTISKTDWISWVGFPSNCVLLGMGMKSGIRFKNAGCKLLRSRRRRKTNCTLLSTNKYFLYWNIYLHTSFPIIRLLFF